MNFIPLVDLNAQYSTIKDEINTAIQSVINDSAFVKGRFVKTFEDSFAEKNGVKYCREPQFHENFVYCGFWA